MYKHIDRSELVLPETLVGLKALYGSLSAEYKQLVGLVNPPMEYRLPVDTSNGKNAGVREDEEKALLKKMCTALWDSLPAKCGCHKRGEIPRMPRSRQTLEYWHHSFSVAACKVPGIAAVFSDEKAEWPRETALKYYWYAAHPHAGDSKKHLKFNGVIIPHAGSAVRASQNRRKARRYRNRRALVSQG